MGTPVRVRSVVSAAIVIVTTAVAPPARRRPDSLVSIVTASRTRLVARSIDTGSVKTSVRPRTVLSGPSTRTCDGVTDTFVTLCPGTGVPSTRGRTGTTADAVASKDIGSAGGVTWRTSTPNGAVTCEGVSGKRRRPARTPSRSTIADRSPGDRPESRLAGPRTRTATESGTAPTSSRSAGARCSSRPMRIVRSTTGSPVTTIHSSVATTTERSFSPAWRIGKRAISPWSPGQGGAPGWPACA